MISSSQLSENTSKRYMFPESTESIQESPSHLDLTWAFTNIYLNMINSIIDRHSPAHSVKSMLHDNLSAETSIRPAIEGRIYNSTTSLTNNCAISSNTNQLLAIMDDEDYISGECADSEEYVKSLMKSNGSKETLDWLINVYLNNHSNSHILVGLLHMLSHFSYDAVYPQGLLIALASFQHENTSVQEFAIKAFENWDDKTTLIYLKQIKLNYKWLQEYLDDVISDIEM